MRDKRYVNTSLRLTRELNERLAHMAQSQGIGKSKLIRQWIMEQAAREDKER